MTTVLIPTQPRPRTFAVALAGITYRLRFHYANAPEAGWLLDIATSTGAPLVAGIPLIPDVDLLQQYAYLGIGGVLFVRSDTGAAPLYGELGTTARLYFQS